MSAEDGAPLTRRAAREARRAGETGEVPVVPGAGARRTGWQPPLREDEVHDRDGLHEVDELHGVPEHHRTADPDPADVPQGPADAADDDHGSGAPSSGPVVSLTKGAAAAASSTGAEDSSPAARRRRRTGGLAQAGAEDFSLAQAVGGVRGAAETLVPGLLFVSTYTLTRDLTIALAVSVGAALLAIVLRVVTRSAPSQALSGAVGVGICAVFALLSGEARNFYLPGFLLNVGYGLLCLLSTVPFRRFRIPRTQRHLGPGPYPVIGLLLGPLTGEGLAWRAVPARLKVYQRVTWLWAGFFLLRLLVQVPLYLADMVGALGAARLLMGPPAFALVVWVSWLLLRAVPRAVPPPAPSSDPSPAQSED